MARPRLLRLRSARVVAAIAFVVAVMTNAPPAARAATTAVVEAPTSIASDCSVDVTKALNQWVATARKGAVLELAQEGCYRVDGTLFVNDKKNLTIDGNGASIETKVPGARDRRHVWIFRGKNIVIRDLRVRGANPTPGPERGYNGAFPFQHAFAFQGVRGARLENVGASAVYGDFVYVGPDTETGRWSTDITVTGSSFDGGGRQGIAVVAGKRIVIDRNYIGGAGLSLFDLEANTDDGGAVDVRITRNRTGAARHFWLANKGAGLNIRRIVVEKNRMEQPTAGLVFVYGPASGYRGPWRFADNRFEITGRVSDEGSQGAFFLARAKDVVIRDNEVTLPVGRNMPAVENRDSLDVVLEGNTFLNAGQELIVTGTARPVAPPTTRAG